MFGYHGLLRMQWVCKSAKAKQVEGGWIQMHGDNRMAGWRGSWSYSQW